MSPLTISRGAGRECQGEEQIVQAHSSNAWERVESWDGVVHWGQTRPCMNCFSKADACATEVVRVMLGDVGQKWIDNTVPEACT